MEAGVLWCKEGLEEVQTGRGEWSWKGVSAGEGR